MLLYLGPHELDAAALRARFRVVCNVEVVLEAVGIDVALISRAPTMASTHVLVVAALAGAPVEIVSRLPHRVRAQSCGISQWIADRRR